MLTTGSPQMPTAHTFSTYCPKKKKKGDVFALNLDPEFRIPQQKLLFSGGGILKPTEFTGKYWFNTTFKEISYGQ